MLLVLILVILRKTGFLGGKDTTDKGKIIVLSKAVSCWSCNLVFADRRFRLVVSQAG